MSVNVENIFIIITKSVKFHIVVQVKDGFRTVTSKPKFLVSTDNQTTLFTKPWS